ncbi:hypothetical protein FS935_08585 [Metabacillus litoralis]|uniref:Peptidase M14 domain-containing protein n=1 Tax=Metabacillus litoralis TaxID=152268 RepID=A0A5C6W551_9BACI|nr:M14 family metallocarboxypeptidase [Metabacillus litoralis]TXC90954.1 hypothetical protein FS935_08585 [Metabacillus litoralis]
MSKILVRLLICILLLSSSITGIPLHLASAQENIDKERSPVFITLRDDTPIISEQNIKIGEISKGATVYGFQLETEIYIDWFGNLVKIDSDYVEKVDNGIEEIPVQDQSENMVIAEEPFLVIDDDGVQIAKVNVGSSFQYVEQFDSYFSSVLFNKKVSLYRADDKIEKVDNAEVIVPESTKPNDNEHKKVSVSSQVTFKKSDPYFKVTNSEVPVYIKDSGKLKQVAILQKGHVFERSNDHTSWHEITLGGKTAFVHKEGTTPYLGAAVNNRVGTNKFLNQHITFKVNTAVYDNSTGRNVHFGTVNKDLRIPVLREYTNWYAIDLSGRIGYIQKKNVNAEFSSSIKYFEVLTNDVVGYKKVNGGLVEVTKLMNGQVYPRVNDYTSWHEIKYGNGTIFVKKEGTRPASEDMIENENNKYKNSPFFVTLTNNTFVYDNSSSSLVKFGELYKGNKYPIISDHGKWIKIDLSSRIGYIKKSDTSIEFSEDIHYFTSTIANVPVYDNSSGQLEIVGYLRSGEVYHRTKDYTSWHEIQFNDKLAYVAKDLTIPVTSQSYRNPSNKYSSVGSFKTTKLTAIYHYVGRDLVPFATIGKNNQYSYVEDRGSYIKVNFADRYGYVKKSDVVINLPVAKDLVNPRVVYSYEQMQADINEIVSVYPDLAKKEIIGKSVDGRNIYAVKIGKGHTEILLNASHHAREYLTTNIVMEMMDQYTQGYVKNTKIDGYNIKSILDKASIWFVPMVNPDGVTLVQKGHKSTKNPSQVLAINGGKTDFSAWKANVRGVDLNRQYPAGWNYIVSDPGRPAPQNYKGPKPLSEPEARAMYDFTNSKDFKTSVSYHSSGEIIYWHFKQGQERTNRDREIGEMIQDKTGYALVTPKSNPSGGGFTDWFISAHLKPGYTPEISPYVGPRPVPIKSFDSIWSENKTIGIMLADEAYKNRNNR